MVEQRIRNAQVPGSIPGGGSSYFSLSCFVANVCGFMTFQLWQSDCGGLWPLPSLFHDGQRVEYESHEGRKGLEAVKVCPVE